MGNAVRGSRRCQASLRRKNISGNLEEVREDGGKQERALHALSFISCFFFFVVVAVIKYPTKAIYKRTGLSGYSPSWLEVLHGPAGHPVPQIRRHREIRMPVLSSRGPEF